MPDVNSCFWGMRGMGVCGCEVLWTEISAIIVVVELFVLAYCGCRKVDRLTGKVVSLDDVYQFLYDRL